MQRSIAKVKKKKRGKIGPARKPDQSQARALFLYPIFHLGFLAWPDVACDQIGPDRNGSGRPF
jgi:hypothetical protein